MPVVCIIADTHRKHRAVTIPPCDILIHCGDIGSFGEDEPATFADADAWFAAAPAQHVICVGGNHDFGLQSGRVGLPSARVLQDDLTEACGLRIYGAPWCPDLPDFAFSLDGRELAERWARIPSGIDILVTHTPPRGILDLPTARDRHLGCPQLRAELDRIRPRLHVFGHVHASHGRHREGATEYINAAIVGGPDFEVRHAPTVRSLDANSGSWMRRLLRR